MSHKMLRPLIVKVSVLGYFPLHRISYNQCIFVEIHYYMLVFLNTPVYYLFY